MLTKIVPTTDMIGQTKESLYLHCHFGMCAIPQVLFNMNHEYTLGAIK